MADGDNKPAQKGSDKEQLQDFVGLPLRTLIVEPLVAAATGQKNLAQVTLDFIKEVGFTTDKSGNTQLRTINIEIPRLIEGRDEPLMQQVSMPLISMVTIPNLAVDSVDIDFTMEVSSQTNNSKDSSSSTTKDHKNTNTNTAKVSGNDWFFSGSDENTNTNENSITGTVSSKSSQTRSTDFSAKYDISVHASQQRPSEGMGILNQIIASSITPVDMKESQK